MQFTIKQRIMAFGKQYRVFDSSGNEVYEVRSQILSPERRKEVLDMQGRLLAWAEWPVMSGQAVLNAGLDSGHMDIPFMSLTPQWDLVMGNGRRYTVEGDLFRMGFGVNGDAGLVASVGKRILAFSDTYEVDVDERSLPPLFALLLVALIDHKFHSDNN